MKYSLRTKISTAFFLMTVILFLFISLTVNSMLKSGFKEYTIGRLEAENKLIVSQLPARYFAAEKSWDVSGVESVGLSAMERGLIIKVLDDRGTVVWDARVYNKGYCSQMLAHMEMNMQQQNPKFKGGYVENKYTLKKGTEKIGQVYIGYYGPYYYSDRDMAYIRTLNKVLLEAGALALVLSLVFGAYLAKRLSRPIGAVIQRAKKIAEGEFDEEMGKTSDTIEINELAETMNRLGNTLGRQRELRKRLSSDMAHELRTPLTTLQSHLELMLDGIWEADGERLKTLQEEAIRLGRLVGDLEKIAEIESEHLTLDITDVDMNMIGESVTKAVESEFQKKGVFLTYTGEEGLVRGDGDKIKQIFMNLLMNALHFTPKGEKVDVIVKKEGEQIAVTVKDSGIGIPTADLPFIFERFYRVDKSRTRHSGGTGIGLAITKALVEAHGGRIFASSEEGRGSCFRFEIPGKMKN